MMHMHIHYCCAVYGVKFIALIRGIWCRMLLARSQMMRIFSRARRLLPALLFLH